MNQKPAMPHIPPASDGSQQIHAARRINDRWIVRGRLRENTADYLAHLESTDPERLVKSCRIALAMVHRRDHHHDPKPLFYAGIFALATDEEVKRFLDGHFLTAATHGMAHGNPARRDSLPGATRALCDFLAEQLSEVLKDA